MTPAPGPSPGSIQPGPLGEGAELQEDLDVLFQVRTDNHIENSEALIEGIRADLEGSLRPRFAEQLRRVEVYLKDVNSHKGGTDTRCTIEAHLAGYQPVAVEGQAGTVEGAVSGELDKLLR